MPLLLKSSVKQTSSGKPEASTIRVARLVAARPPMKGLGQIGLCCPGPSPFNGDGGSRSLGKAKAGVVCHIRSSRLVRRENEGATHLCYTILFNRAGYTSTSRTHKRSHSQP